MNKTTESSQGGEVKMAELSHILQRLDDIVYDNQEFGHLIREKVSSILEPEPELEPQINIKVDGKISNNPATVVDRLYAIINNISKNNASFNGIYKHLNKII